MLITKTVKQEKANISQKFIGQLTRREYDMSLSIIDVKIEDMPKASPIFIKIKCDGCGKEFDISIYNYFRNKTKMQEEFHDKDCCEKITCRRQFKSLTYNCKQTTVVEVDGKFLESKECTSCHEMKVLTDYPVNSRRTTGRAGKCKACMKDYVNADGRKEKYSDYRKNYYLDNAEKIKEYKAQWFQSKKSKSPSADK